MQPTSIFDEIDRMEREFFGGFMGGGPQIPSMQNRFDTDLSIGSLSNFSRRNQMHDKFSGDLQSHMMDELRKPIVMPGWSVPNQYTSVCPRDVMITVGNIMVEAPVSRRDRFLEYQAY